MTVGFRLALLAVAAAVVTAVITLVIVRISGRIGLLDHPNARSSHRVVTPRGGGLSIVIVLAVGIACFSDFDGTEIWALLPPFLIVSAIGFVDDLRGLSSVARFIVHLCCASWLVLALGELPRLTLPLFDVPPVGVSVLLIIGVTWFLNAFNFMDGIDGLAASQSLFFGAGLVLFLAPDATSPTVQVGAVLVGASAGFLLFNWSPARIFMGDVGSGAVGFLLAALCVMAWMRGEISLWASGILLTLFLADATGTLLRRISRGAKWYSPHRSHVYQRLARRLDSHARVTLIYGTVNVLLVAPLALLASASHEPLAFSIWLGAVAVGCAAVVMAGGGVEGD